MNKRRQRLLDLPRSRLRILSPDPLLPESLPPRLLTLRRDLFLDLPHELGHPRPIRLRHKTPPAGNLTQDHLLRHRKLPRPRLLPLEPGVLLEPPVEPGPLHPIPGDQRLRAMHARPVKGLSTSPSLLLLA